VEPRDDVPTVPCGFGCSAPSIPGSRPLKLGAPKGRITPQGDGQKVLQTIVGLKERLFREASEVLEGECKAMNGA
jgi:hypothetical protein